LRGDRALADAPSARTRLFGREKDAGGDLSGETKQSQVLPWYPWPLTIHQTLDNKVCIVDRQGMTPERREALRLNMYPGAHGAIEDWDAFHWHTYAASPRSSQMLAIDVFGTLRTRPQAEIDSALSRIGSRPGS